MMNRLIDDAGDRDEALALITDEELLRAWQLSGGEGLSADAIAAEMARREIDF